MSTTSRRRFIAALAGMARASGGWSADKALLGAQLAALASLSTASRAADTSGYKALVCLFMNGGCDTHNWVVPVDAENYALYTRSRAELAWPLARLQGITVSGQAAGRSFAMPTELAPLRRWYEAGRAAIVANVGPLSGPTTKADFLAGTGIPQKLFSHNDQASTWQSLSPEGARSGWGGRMADVLMGANGTPVLTAVSASGNAVFLSGTSVTQFQVGTDGPVGINGVNATSIFGSSQAPAALRRVLGTSSSDPLLAEYLRVLQRGASANGVLQSAISSTAVPALPVTTVASGASTTTLDKLPLARQLRTVMQMIAAAQHLSMRRQVFLVSMNGFDTHAYQLREQPGHMAQVAGAIDYFLSGLSTLGLLGNVTLFTASDFGRTLVSNGAGSDHGWGSHHFVAGGAVRGQAMMGRFPDLSPDSADDIGSGRLLPGIAVSQLAASLGGWMGLSSSELSVVLPNLGNFSALPALFQA